MRKEKILLIAPVFYDYEKEIKEELELKGYNVTFISLHIFNSYLKYVMTLIKKISRKLYYQIYKFYFKKKILQNGNNSFDKIIVINGETLTREAIKSIKKTFLKNKEELYLYIWVPISRNLELLEFSKEYSQVFSFEEKDCKNYGFRFLPNFYSSYFSNKVFQKEKIEKTKDIFFMGIYRKDRYELKEKIEKLNLNTDILLYHNRISYYLKKFFKYSEYKGIKSSKLVFLKMDRKEIYQRILQAEVLLDNSEIGQEGLTQRILDSLVLKKKVITTNSNVTTYDFYNPNNILVINLENPEITSKFFDKPYTDIDEKIIKKYSLERWVNYLLNKEEMKK